MKGSRLLIVATCATLLSGCLGGNDFSDLDAFMAEQKARPKGKIEPLPVFPPYEAFTYAASALRSPFQPPVRIALDDRERGNRDVRPDEGRPKQYLESFSIDEFIMVGTLSRADGMYGLVRGGGGVHRVGIGDYLGRNHGRIIAIDGAELQVVEIVPDGVGGWLERPRTLPLKERS